jgi:hypothetical protein
MALSSGQADGGVYYGSGESGAEDLRESPGKLLIGGGILWCIVLVAFTMIPALLLRLVKKVYPFPAFILETFWCYQILAAKSLRTESMKVYRQLERGNLAGARQGGFYDRGKRHRPSGRRGRGKSGGRNSGGKYVGRRDSARYFI